MRIIQTADLLAETPLSQEENDWVYNGLDVCVTLEIVNVLLAQLDNTTSATYEFSKSLQGPTLEMNMSGLLVDKRRRDAVLLKFRHELSVIEGQFHEIMKEVFGLTINWNSAHQLKHLFYDVMGFTPIRKRGPNGMTVTADREALEKLSHHMMAEPLCLRILAMRDIIKKIQFLKTPLDSDGRMRCSFNIAGTNTGRFSSALSDLGTGRNLQNIDRDLRSVFIADPGMKFANLDLEQADARNVGALCWNYFLKEHGASIAGGYLDACESGDLHTATAKLAWPDLPWSGSAKDNRAIADQIIYRQDSYRQLAKKLGHGTNYYGTPRTMAMHTKTPVQQITEFQDRYFRGFPCIPLWHKRVKEMLIAESQITTLFGRRRTFFGRPQADTTIREAIAYAPQSMTAEEINIGMLKLFRTGRVNLLVQVHDSILFQFPEDREDEIVPMAINELHIPLTLFGDRQFVVPVDAKIGWNWGEVVTDKTGKILDNEEGLMKWKGNDRRTRQENLPLSLQTLLL